MKAGRETAAIEAANALAAVKTRRSWRQVAVAGGVQRTMTLAGPSRPHIQVPSRGGGRRVLRPHIRRGRASVHALFCGGNEFLDRKRKV